MELCNARTASEEILAKIWSDVLRVRSIDGDVNFFDIGGDSLKATEVISRIRETLQVDLPLMAFFEDPTVGHLASVVDELKAETAPKALHKVPGQIHFPLSYSQQVFWLLEQQNPGTGLYNTARIFQIRGDVEPGLMEGSLNELRRRHEILRVRFIQGVDGPVQIVEAGSPLQLAINDVSSLEGRVRDETARRLAHETVREPLDVVAGPPLRARLIRVASQEWLLCIAIHHAVSDGITGSIFLDELCTIYDALQAGEPNPLPELEVHFTDYAAWERQCLTDTVLEQELKHWRSVLQDAPTSLTLPSDFARSSEPDRTGHLRSITLPLGVLRDVRAFAQTNGTTLFAALAAAFRILLFRWSEQSDFVLGTIASNRSRGGTERMLGCFVNPLALRNPLDAGQSVREVLGRETQCVMEAFAHADAPFTKIVEAINPERTSNDNPLFNVALLLQNFPAIARKGRCFEAEHLNLNAEVALLDLRFIAMETGDGLQVTCEYKTQLFKDDTIDTLLNSYSHVLKAIISDPDQPVAAIALPDSLLQQAAAARSREQTRVAVIAASFTAEPLEEPLSFLLNKVGMNYRVAFAPYHQLFQQLLDPASLLRTSDELKIVLARFESWLHGESALRSARPERLEQIADELIAALRQGDIAGSPLIVCFCPASRSISEDLSCGERLRSLEIKVADAFVESSSVHVIRSEEILDLYPVEKYEDEYAKRLGNVPYTTDFFSALGTMLARSMWNLLENRYAAIAIDCDGVLWSGTCDAGQQVLVNESHIALQRALLRQRDAGVLLCLCSKYNEQDVWAAFESNASMPLRRHHITGTAMGSGTTPQKLVSLADELGLELDRFMFLNADPAETSILEAGCPEVLSLQVPADADEIPTWLKHVWAFDRAAGRKHTFVH
jgi:acyl carrier protein